MTKENGFISIETAVEDWFKENVDIEEIDKKTQATVDYIKKFMEPENGEWTVFAYEAVGGAHGQFTIQVFLDDILNKGNEKYMNEKDLDVIMETFDTTQREVAKLFNLGTSLSGDYYVGNNEADESLGLFYSVRA